MRNSRQLRSHDPATRMCLWGFKKGRKLSEIPVSIGSHRGRPLMSVSTEDQVVTRLAENVHPILPSLNKGSLTYRKSCGELVRQALSKPSSFLSCFFVLLELSWDMFAILGPALQ